MYRIILPRNLNKFTIREIIIEFRKYVDTCSQGLQLEIDMTLIEFIEPAGVISLNNIIQWSRSHKDIKINFLVNTETRNPRNKEAIATRRKWRR